MTRTDAIRVRYAARAIRASARLDGLLAYAHAKRTAYIAGLPQADRERELALDRDIRQRTAAIRATSNRR